MAQNDSNQANRSAVELLRADEPQLYFAVTMKCPRRFCCQQASVSSVQDGCSSPLLTIVIRSVGDAEADQVVADRVGAALAERQVVLVGAARVGVPFDHDLGARSSASATRRSSAAPRAPRSSGRSSRSAKNTSASGFSAFSWSSVLFRKISSSVGGRRRRGRRRGRWRRRRRGRGRRAAGRRRRGRRRAAAASGFGHRRRRSRGGHQDDGRTHVESANHRTLLLVLSVPRGGDDRSGRIGDDVSLLSDHHAVNFQSA